MNPTTAILCILVLALVACSTEAQRPLEFAGLTPRRFEDHTCGNTDLCFYVDAQGRSHQLSHFDSATGCPRHPVKGRERVHFGNCRRLGGVSDRPPADAKRDSIYYCTYYRNHPQGCATGSKFTVTLKQADPNAPRCRRCPAGTLAHPDDPTRCGRILTVASGNQRRGRCGAQNSQISRCNAHTPASLRSLRARACYSNLKIHGQCIDGYNCPSDRAHRDNRACFGKTWTLAAPGRRCVKIHNRAGQISCMEDPRVPLTARERATHVRCNGAKVGIAAPQPPQQNAPVEQTAQTQTSKPGQTCRFGTRRECRHHCRKRRRRAVACSMKPRALCGNNQRCIAHVGNRCDSHPAKCTAFGRRLCGATGARKACRERIAHHCRKGRFRTSTIRSCRRVCRHICRKEAFAALEVFKRAVLRADFFRRWKLCRRDQTEQPLKGRTPEERTPELKSLDPNVPKFPSPRPDCGRYHFCRYQHKSSARGRVQDRKNRAGCEMMAKKQCEKVNAKDRPGCRMYRTGKCLAKARYWCELETICGATEKSRMDKHKVLVEKEKKKELAETPKKPKPKQCKVSCQPAPRRFSVGISTECTRQANRICAMTNPCGTSGVCQAAVSRNCRTTETVQCRDSCTGKVTTKGGGPSQTDAQALAAAKRHNFVNNLF